jgi:plastocyanin
VTAADETSNLATSGVAQAAAGMENRHEPEMQMDGTMQMDHGMMHMRDGAMMHMQDSAKTVPANVRRRFPVQGSKTAAPTQTSLVGCLTIATDGKAILKALQSAKIYRLEAQPLLFSQNANRLVNVNGRFGSVMASEDPSLASFVVASIDEVAPNCSAKLSAAQIQRTLLKRAEADKGIVKMSDMGFLPPTLTVNAGERVAWMNSSEVTHNVIADPAKALYEVDVKLPSGVKPFGSGYLQPGQSFSRTFEVPGTYRYVCTLHESSGMKGIIIVRPSQVLRASK